MKLFWLLSLIHFGNGICPRSAETAPQFEEFLNLTQGENLYDGQLRLIQGPDQTYGRGRLEVYSEKYAQWGTVNGFDYSFAEAQVSCRAMGFSCVMDWGLASDWGIPPAPERKPIGYWGHQCDGDEPGLNYCCGADRRWIGTKHLTNSGFQRNHF